MVKPYLAVATRGFLANTLFSSISEFGLAVTRTELAGEEVPTWIRHA